MVSVVRNLVNQLVSLPTTSMSSALKTTVLIACMATGFSSLSPLHFHPAGGPGVGPDGCEDESDRRDEMIGGWAVR